MLTNHGQVEQARVVDPLEFAIEEREEVGGEEVLVVAEVGVGVERREVGREVATTGSQWRNKCNYYSWPPLLGQQWTPIGVKRTHKLGRRRRREVREKITLSSSVQVTTTETTTTTLSVIMLLSNEETGTIDREVKLLYNLRSSFQEELILVKQDEGKEGAKVLSCHFNRKRDRKLSEGNKRQMRRRGRGSDIEECDCELNEFSSSPSRECAIDHYYQCYSSANCDPLIDQRDETDERSRFREIDERRRNFKVRSSNSSSLEMKMRNVDQEDGLKRKHWKLLEHREDFKRFKEAATISENEARLNEARLSLASHRWQEDNDKNCKKSYNINNKRSQMMIKLGQLLFIYIFITSSLYLPATSSNYWPQRKQSPMTSPADRLPSLDQQQQQQQQQPSGNSRQLMIGQHYSNFSSIVPYSIVQDADYSNSAPEDQLLDEQQPQPVPVQPMQPVSISSMRQQEQLEHRKQEQNFALMAVSGDILASEQKANSRASLLPGLDSGRLVLPQMQQIKSRFNQGCVGGTKCSFFAFCWMSGGSLGASCGLLMTCCVTPSRQEIQPGFYGPVVNDPYCGRSTSKINRIVGGTDASFGQFPWQAFVQVGGSRCGGALISSRHVVTAGHCVARSQHSPSSIKVTLGDYILNSDIESIPHEVFSVVEVLLHPNFRFTPQADRYDVAVLELDRTASYKDNIKPICLPQKDAAFVGRVAYVAGWGALQAGSKLRPKVLQHVAVPVIENNVCESWHRRKGIDIRIYDEMMCAGYELGQRDACQGDSGGPLMLNQFGVWYLVGIVSAGYSCAKQYQPGIYHRVSSSSDWISSNVYQQGANK